MLTNYQTSKILVDERQGRLVREAAENRLARTLRTARRARTAERRSH